MKESLSQDNKISRVYSWNFVLGLTFILFTLAILVLRVLSVLRDSFYFPISDDEATPLYGIYKVWRHQPLYHSLEKNPSTFSFNFLFYYLYGFIARLFVFKETSLSLFSHFLTLLATLFLLTAMLYFTYSKVKEHARNRGGLAEGKIIFFIPVTVCLGTFVGWWNFTIRPDIFALAFEIFGLLLFIRLFEKQSKNYIIPVTFVFWLSWAMKQTSVFAWVGVLLYLLFTRHYRQVLISVAVFLLLSLAPLVLFNQQDYIAHAIIMPPVTGFSFQKAIWNARDAFFLGGYLYFTAIAFLLFYLKSLWRGIGEKGLSITAVVLITTLLVNFITSAKYFSTRNYYFSSFFAAALFIIQYAAFGLNTQFRSERSYVLKVLFISFFVGLCITAPYLLFPNRIGRISMPALKAPYGKDEAVRLREAVLLSKKPVFVEWSYFALPWHSGQDPSEVIDWPNYLSAMGKYSIVSVQEKTLQKHYKEAFVHSQYFIDLFEGSGYKRQGRFADMIRFE